VELTEGTLLGGRVIYRQPSAGYRTGIEPVLLAASVPVQPGMRVLEAGTGAGAGLLCLLARAPGVAATGVEQDCELADLARANLAANGMAGVMETANVLALPPMPAFDHAMANPPWHDSRSTPSPIQRRDVAKRASPELLGDWTAALVRVVRPGGGLTFILPAAAVAEAIAALAVLSCGSMTLLPLWPRTGQECRLVLVQAIKGARGPSRILPGLVLHEGDGFTEAARAILWAGAALKFG
jgi:tRNA1Val (adenine37-N6)-methyltransferase